MGGLIIVSVRPGVRFTPEAAAAFRRADAQVVAEFGRDIDVNSTYRSWSDQMIMFTNWNKYVAGKGPYPGHSKAVHPSESFHVQGVALDSDDWRVPRIVEILAENGFIRNRLYVKNEQHHFEYIQKFDRNLGKPAGGANTTPITESEEDDMKFLYVDDDGNGKGNKVWVLMSVRTSKFITTKSQSQANLWATVWGDAIPVTRDAYLTAIDAIQKTA